MRVLRDEPAAELSRRFQDGSRPQLAQRGITEFLSRYGHRVAEIIFYTHLAGQQDAWYGAKTFLEPREKPLDGMYLPTEKAEMVLKLLLEGNSVSSVERITDVHHTTILKLLVLAGERCERLMARKVQSVAVRDVECDEVWSFIGKKEKRVRPDDDQNLGDCYTFVAVERHSKLVLNIAMGKRDQATTDVFIEGLRDATRGSFQITTDGFAPYRSERNRARTSHGESLPAA